MIAPCSGQAAIEPARRLRGFPAQLAPDDVGEHPVTHSRPLFLTFQIIGSATGHKGHGALVLRITGLNGQRAAIRADQQTNMLRIAQLSGTQIIEPDARVGDARLSGAEGAKVGLTMRNSDMQAFIHQCPP